MIGRLIVGIVLLGVFSCSEIDSPPAALLSTEKMELLLWDLLRAEQFTANYVISRDSTKSARATGPLLYEAILKKHGTTDSLFRLSLNYYKKHPKLFLPILDSIGLRPDLTPTQLVNSTAVGRPDTLTPPVDPAVSPKFTRPLPSSKLLKH